MTFTNSPLVNYTRISPNKNENRTHEIDTITIHCVCGQVTVERLGEIFAPTSRKASSNYGIGYDGKIGLYCDEKDRSWCSSNAANDHRAITIEVASDAKAPYAVTDKAYASLIKLVADVCKRNGIKELKWKGDKNLIGQVSKQNMTVHRWFSATKSCPGEYLYERMGDIANRVNKILKAETTKTEPSKPAKKEEPVSAFKKGDTVSISSNATYYNGKKIPDWVKKKTWIVEEVKGDRVVINKSSDGKNAISSPVNAKYLTKKTASNTSSTSSFKSYTVIVNTAALNIRRGPGTNYSVVGTIKDRGVYTIVDEKNGWGKLKSGAGWISLAYCKKK